MEKPYNLAERFRAHFGEGARFYRAPGRVNLIGEHTDYNDGFVLPAAINFHCWLAVSPRVDTQLVIRSDDFDQTRQVDLSDNTLRPSLEHLCQKAENEFVGARCGIMDQFVSLHGRAGHALLLDCRSLQYELVPIPDSVKLVICNTMVKHELATGEYNRRRAECEEAVRCLSAVLPGIRALRDVNPEQLEKHRGVLPDTVWRRAHHVISENARVLQAVAALRGGNIKAFGKAMAASHESLRDGHGARPYP